MAHLGAAVLIIVEARVALIGYTKSRLTNLRRQLVKAKVLHDRVIEYTLSDGRKIQRDFSLIRGGIFNSKKWTDPKNFAKASVRNGEPSWPGELDFCSDVILRGGLKGRVPAFAFVGNGPNGGRLLSRKAGEAALEELWNEVNIPIVEKRLAEIDAGRRKAIPLDEVFARIEKADQDQDRLVDQICLELEEIGASFWRMFNCWKALDPDKQDALQKKFFDYFLTNAERSLLGKTKAMVASWRSKRRPKGIPRRTLESHRETERVHRFLEGFRELDARSKDPRSSRGSTRGAGRVVLPRKRVSTVVL